MDLPSANNTSFVAAEGLKRVNWLTLVGAELSRRAQDLERLSGVPSVALHGGPNGVVVQAGDVPQLGDANQRDTCAAYHVVGRALRDVRCKRHPAFILDESGFAASPERSDEWLSYFDT